MDLRHDESRLSVELGVVTADIAGVLAGIPRELLPGAIAMALADADPKGRVQLTGGFRLNLADGRPSGLHAVAEFAELSMSAPKSDVGDYRLSDWRGRLFATDGPHGELMVDLLDAVGNLSRGQHRAGVGGLSARLTLNRTAVTLSASAVTSPLGPVSAVLVGGGKMAGPNGGPGMVPAPWELAVQARPVLNDGLWGLLPDGVANTLREASAGGELPFSARLRWPAEGRARAELAAVVRDAHLAAAGLRVTGLSASVRSEPGLLTFRIIDLNADVSATGAFTSKAATKNPGASNAGTDSVGGANAAEHSSPTGWLTGSAELTLPGSAGMSLSNRSSSGRVSAQLRFGGLPVPMRYLAEVPELHSVRLDGTLSANLPMDPLAGDGWLPNDALTLSDGRVVIEHVHAGSPTTLRTFAVAGLGATVVRDPAAPTELARFRLRDGRIAELLGGSAEFTAELDFTTGVYRWRVPKMPLDLRPGDALSLPKIGELLDTFSRPVGSLTVVASGEYRIAPPTGEPQLTWKLERAELNGFSTRLGRPEYRATQMVGVLTGDDRELRSEQITFTVADGRATVTNIRVGLPRGNQRSLTYAADVRAEDVELKALLDAGKRPGVPAPLLAERSP